MMASSTEPAITQESSKVLPQKPEDWPALFVRHFNAGDLDAVMALYEPEAHFIAKSGETLVGRDQIRKVLGGMINAKTRFHSRVIKAVTVGDIAQLYTDFEGTTVDASGKTIAIRTKAVEILRRQPNGDWLLIMGDPDGRGIKRADEIQNRVEGKARHGGISASHRPND
jgi:uncharacterized protein (TIGR02246 family)